MESSNVAGSANALTRHWWAIALGVLVLLVIWTVSIYNGIVRANLGAEEAWGQVENVYQRRLDLIPNLMESVRGYMDHERETLEAVAQARQQVMQVKLDAETIGRLAESPELQKKFFEAQESLGSAVSRLLAVAESYPNLKASAVFQQFMDEQAGTENRVAVERRRFQEKVNECNTRILTFPGNIVAGIFGFRRRDYFRAESGAEKAPKVNFRND